MIPLTAFFFDKHHHMPVFRSKFPMEYDLPVQGRPIIPENVLEQNVIDVGAAGIYDTGMPSALDVHKLDPNVDTPVIVALRGYFQSWKYFDDHRALIQRQFTFSLPVYQRALQTLTAAVQNYTKRSGTSPTTIVGVHVRRGDILKPVMKKYGHTTAPKAYLSNLVRNMTETYRPALFVVLSNDQPYCQQILSKAANVVFIAGNTPEVDMAILSLMDHLILTVGTFGWWGAYLSDAQDVYYYRKWPVYGSQMDKEYSRKDYFIPSWKPAE